MRPGRRQLYLFAGWALLALVLALLRPWLTLGQADTLTLLWWSAGAIFVVLLMVDLAGYRKNTDVQVTRQMPASFSLGAANAVKLRIDNPFPRPLHLVVHDQYPDQVQVDAFPYQLTIPANEYGEIRYEAQPTLRGDATFGKTELRILSPWRLWEYHIKQGESAVVKIYPNFTNIGTLSMLQHGQQINQLGIHVQQRRGEGINFHQLREYRKGDSLSQIDWKATSRYVKLISRGYEDERDQDIIFLLDCGRRMRALDGELSHFDYALNALLLMSYIALKQGDAVGVLTFAGETLWIPPMKGPTAINKLLNSVYDLHSTTKTSDFLQAVEQLTVHHRKRALVIVLSNVREEDQHDLLAATRTLSKHHLVMVASLREQFLDNAMTTPVENFESALRYSGVQQLLQQRKRVLDTLVDRGVVITDSLARHLHIDLTNQYLNLKRSGRI